jgi:hypothetical protein
LENNWQGGLHQNCFQDAPHFPALMPIAEEWRTEAVNARLSISAAPSTQQEIGTWHFP